ncbi:unnamed protein product [Cochlearia groenlandica]
MTCFEMNVDMIMEILSRAPISLVEKCRILNKECNNRTYDSVFHKLNLQKTNSIYGYFYEYLKRGDVYTGFVKESSNTRREDDEMSLGFLPRRGRRSMEIKACDATHGILLCVEDCITRPTYIVCKPTTKQYTVIPKPKTRYFTVLLGLMVIGTDPFRFKILRVSRLSIQESRTYRYNTPYACEVFDSDTFKWKRIKNFELPQREDIFSSRNCKPVVSYGFLHWLTYANNVFRFCFKTDTWSFIPVHENLANDGSLVLARYEGKLGLVSKDELWVLDKCFGSLWVKVKDIKSLGLEFVEFLGNDVVTLAGQDKICLYNMNNGKSQNLQIRIREFMHFYLFANYFPFYSDYERIELGGRCKDYHQQQDKSL